MKNVLVTGASGFVGGHVVRALRARNIPVRCLVRRTSRLDSLQPSAVELAWGDLNEPGTLASALAGVDAVVHCAGLTRARSRSEYFRVNTEGCRNLYSACGERKGQFARIIHVSSLAALGPSVAEKPVEEDSFPNPVSDYGNSKLAGQNIAKSAMKALPISILIPPAVYGPQDADFLSYFKLVARGFVPLVGNCPRHLSLIYVKDLAEAILQLLLAESAYGKSYLVSDGGIYAWTDVAQAIGIAMNRHPRYVHVPVSVASVFGLAGDLAARLTGKARLISSDRIRDLVQPSWTCSSRRITEELGFRPRYSLESGMQETYSWYRENSWL